MSAVSTPGTVFMAVPVVEIERGVAAVEFGRFAQIALAPDPEADDLTFGARRSAFRAGRRFRIVRSACDRFVVVFAGFTAIIVKRHPSLILALYLKQGKVRVLTPSK